MFWTSSSRLCAAALAFLALCLTSNVTGQVPVMGVKSFSSAIKAGRLEANKEKTLFEINKGPGFFTEMWFTGGGLDNKTVIRIYLDGNMSDPAIEFNLFLGHSIGCQGVQERNQTPWHTTHFGHESVNGGLYNTYRIPFGAEGAMVTAQNPTGGQFFYIVRGLLNTPLVVDGFSLPNNTRLRLYRKENITLEPLQFLPLADIQERSGWIYQVAIDANSSSFHYLEACFRLNIDGGETEFLSSGTEDFFLSAYYFNRGTYRADHSGLSCKVGPGQMSAYKFFATDPLFFSKSALLRWRCGETVGDANGCPNNESIQNSRHRRDVEDLVAAGSSVTTVTTYVWVYEY